MSVRNVDTVIPYHAREGFRITKPLHKVPISCMFLSNFEMKKGNITVWSRKWSETNCEIDLDNVEFKALPSGIHEVSDDVINFVLPKEVPSNDYYYGVAYYQQNGQEMAEGTDHLDRNAVKMYALGVIVDPNYRVSGPSNSDEWKPNQFTSANDYVQDLQELLTHWMAKKQYDNFSLFEEYFNCNSLTNDSAGLAAPILQRSGKPARDIVSPDANLISEDASRPQMLEYLPFWIRKLGPLVFPLWKSCLLGERILILNPPGGSFELCNALNYCLSIISLIPKALLVNRHEEYEYFVKPLFTIGISDIDSMISDVRQVQTNAKPGGFIACTSDEIITSKIELYDKVLKVSKETAGEGEDDAAIYSNTGLQVKATPHDFESLQSFYENFLHEEMSLTAKGRYSSMVEPKTWTQSLIDGFYWWATAGYVKPSYNQERVHSGSTPPEDNEAEMVSSIVGYFHDRTSLLFNKLKAIIEANECQGSDEIIFIHPMALGDMDLDCFSMQDRDFIIALSWKLFQKEVRITGDYYDAIC